MITNIDARLVYENAKNALVKAFPNVPEIAQQVKLTQSTLRFEQPLIAGNTRYTFPVLVNEAIFSNTEKRLQQQDSAVLYQLGVFVALAATDKTSAYTLHSYPNSTLFATGAAAMQSLYNGNLTVAVNNDILIPHWDVFKHYKAPETQQDTGIVDELAGSEDGFYPVEPNIVLIGSKNNVINIDIPAGIGTVDAGSRIVIIARCVIAQNSTVVS